MAEIKYDFSKHNAPNALHAQWVTKTLEVVPQEKADELGFGEQRKAFGTVANQELTCFKPEKSYLDTPEVKESDDGRDDTYYFYKQIARAYANYCPDAEKKAAGEIVNHAFDEAGEVAKLEMGSQTSTMTDFVEKLRKEPYISALTTIGMEEAPDKLEAANKKFDTVYSKRAAEEYSRASTFTMKALRPEVDKAFNEMAKAINALYTVNEMVTKDEEKREALEEIIENINIHLHRFRKTMNGSQDSETPTTPEVPDEPTDPTEPEEPTTGEGEEGGGETTNPGEEEEGTGAIPHP